MGQREGRKGGRTREEKREEESSRRRERGVVSIQGGSMEGRGFRGGSMVATMLEGEEKEGEHGGKERESYHKKMLLEGRRVRGSCSHVIGAPPLPQEEAVCMPPLQRGGRDRSCV